MRLDAVIRKQLPGFQLDTAIQSNAASLVLWGASGAGKTLTLNCLAGFSRPDAGRILADGHLFFDAATRVHVPPQRRCCGYIFQEHALFPRMTVMQNLRFAASVSSSAKKTRIKEWVEAFELGDIINRKPAQLSGGQQQRAALARALVGEPNLLLLDEPTQGLDQRLKSGFFELLREIRRRSEAVMLLVTHDLNECFEWEGDIFLLSQGKLLQSGPMADVLSKPASLEAARSLGIYNLVPAEVESLDPTRNTSRLRTPTGTWNGIYYKGHLLGDKGFAVFRESAVQIAPGGDMPFTVRSLRPYSYGVRVECQGGVAAIISAADAADIKPGDMIRAKLHPSDMVFLSK